MVHRKLLGCSHIAAAWALALALLVPGPVAAQQPPLQLSQYAHTAWTAREGADMGLVFAMTQTPDGYLWVAGLFGLYRFDGLRFQRWQPPNGQDLPGGAYRLLVSKDGTLWIGTFEGLASWNGRDYVYRVPEIGKGMVTSLIEDREGTVWAGAVDRDGTVWGSVERTRLCALRGAKASCTGSQESFGAIWSLAEDPAGNLWVGADSGVWKWRPGAPQRLPLPAGMRVGDLVLGDDGQIIVGDSDKGLWQVAGDRLQPYRFHHAGKPGAWLADREVRSNRLMRDRDGGLWIGSTGLGLIHVRDGQADRFTRADGLSGNIACGFFQDREGNVWYGSEKGLDRFRKLPVPTLSTRQGVPDEVVKSVLAASDGSLWVATNDGLARWQGGRLSVYREAEGLPDARVLAQYQDADGRLWVSTARGLAYLAGSRFVAVPAVTQDQVQAITGDDAGNLWLSSPAALLRLHRGRLAETVPWSVFKHPRQAQVLTADRGGVWASFWEDGAVAFFKDGRVEAMYKSLDGLGKGHVAGHRLDAEGAVWAATDDGGLARIKDGRVTTLSSANGLPCDRMQWSLPDDEGALWMAMGCGLVRIGPQDLAAWLADPRHRVTPKVWGTADGVPVLMGGMAAPNPFVAKGADGRLWFVTGVELKSIDPAAIPSNQVPPPVHVESLVADHRNYAVADGLRLPPLVRDVAIGFNALNLADPRSTRFRYRLEGHDSDWLEAVDRRLATYTNLPPGDYRFRVKAANNSGVWNEEGAQLSFSIAPALHQTTGFRVALAALLAGALWGVVHLWHRMRVRRLRREFEATLEARVAERTRIARDLHDTLLQRFHGLLLQFQAAINLLPGRPQESRQILVAAVDRAAEAITEGRDTVQGLRSPAPDSQDLADALRALADELGQDSGHAAPVRVEVRGEPQPLKALAREEALRIAAEALANAMRHAGAGCITVEIRFERRALRVTVRDDGRGIEPAVLREGGRPGHFGLSGMRERAELVGGRLHVRSSPAAGTEIEFRLPRSRAYSQTPSGLSWLLHKITSMRSAND